jgi:hypothetical protein
MYVYCGRVEETHFFQGPNQDGDSSCSGKCSADRCGCGKFILWVFLNKSGGPSHVWEISLGTFCTSSGTGKDF